MKQCWYVLHVKPRTEKKTAQWLKVCRLWHYLALYKKTVRLQRRKVTRLLPVFPGYVFVRMDPRDRIRVLKSNLIVRTIAVDRPREMIHQLRQIKNAGRTGREIRVVERFSEGEKVRIKSGPFYGVEGYVKEDRGGVSVILNIEILGQAVAVSLSPAEVESLRD
jgi:transcription antitermination factor NusG